MQVHFPDYAVMPGVLIIEAMAQAAGALVVHTLSQQDQHKLVYFMTIDKARFRRPVHPGDLLRIPVSALQRHRGPVWRFEGKAYVGSNLCAEAEYSAMILDSGIRAGRLQGSTWRGWRKSIPQRSSRRAQVLARASRSALLS